MKPRFQIFKAAYAALIFGLWLVGPVCAQTDLSGRTPDSIASVLRLVANHQRGTIADGTYPVCYTTNAARLATRPTGLTFNYPWGVNLCGQLQTARALGDTNIESFALQHNLIVGRYYAWLRGLALTCTNALGQPENMRNFYAGSAIAEYFLNDIAGLGKLDYCGSMNSSILQGALFHTNGPTLGQLMISTNTAAYITTNQARLPDGTLYRPERSFTVWADDLYMSCPFLLRWWQATGDTNYLDDAARQVGNMAGYLQDTNGIWYHGYYYTSNKVNGWKWCRANGWAMIATEEVLAVMPTNHPARSNLLSVLQRHIDGIKAVQGASGLWRQILDDTNIWEETSSSAMFTYGIARAVNRGWVDATNMTYAYKGFVGVCTKIAANGDVGGTCTGTSLDTTYAYYLARTHNGANEIHGIGPVMLAGAELLLATNVPPPDALNIVQASSTVTLTWPAALTNYVVHSSTNLVDWKALPGVPVLSNAFNVLTDGFGAGRTYQLRLPQPTNFEAEAVSLVASGATTTTSSDASASGGLWVLLNSTNAGPYIEFTIPNIAAGTYQLQFRYRYNTSRGQMTLALDGAPLGGMIDQYAATAGYTQTNLGNVVFPVKSNHVVRLSVTGRNAASTGYGIAADSFLLVPQ